MDISKIELDQSEHKFEDIVFRQNAAPEIVKIFLLYLEGLKERIRKEGGQEHYKLHKYGVSISSSDTKVFVYIDFHLRHLSMKFRTGNSTIVGLEKANWGKGDNKGSETFHVDDSDTAEQAFGYAMAAYNIALKDL
jgi:hypothetical protein